MATYPAIGVGLVRVSDYSFTLPGDVTAIFTRRRSVLAKTTDGTPTTGITVLTSSYSDATALTTITTTGDALPSPLVSIAPGQAVANSPALKADTDEYDPCILSGTGKWINPILHNQFWS